MGAPHCQNCAALKTQIEDLQDQLKAFEEYTTRPVRGVLATALHGLPPEARIIHALTYATPSHAAILWHLYTAQNATCHDLWDAIPHTRSAMYDTADGQLIRVHVFECNRTFTAKYGHRAICHRRGRGYALTPETREHISKILEAHVLTNGEKCAIM